MVASAPLLLALLLSLTHLSSGYLSRVVESYHTKIVSFSAGILVALLFLSLLPEAVKGHADAPIYAFLLLGFVVFHLTEKYLYQHITDKKRLLRDLAELHRLGFFLDHFIVGLVLVLTAQITPSLGLALFIPFFFHTLSSSLSLEHLHERFPTHLSKLILASSPFLGAVAASALRLTAPVFYGLFAFTLGLLLYVVTRDMLPQGKRGDSGAFLLGTLLVTLLVFLSSL